MILLQRTQTAAAFFLRGFLPLAFFAGITTELSSSSADLFSPADGSSAFCATGNETLHCFAGARGDSTIAAFSFSFSNSSGAALFGTLGLRGAFRSFAGDFEIIGDCGTIGAAPTPTADTLLFFDRSAMRCSYCNSRSSCLLSARKRSISALFSLASCAKYASNGFSNGERSCSSSRLRDARIGTAASINALRATLPRSALFASPRASSAPLTPSSWWIQVKKKKAISLFLKKNSPQLNLLRLQLSYC